MFDTITPPEPEDVFKDIEEPIPPVLTPPTPSSVPVISSPTSPPLSPSVPSPSSMSAGKIALFIAGAVVIVGIAGFISYYVLSAREPVVPAIVTQEPAGETTEPAQEEPAVTEPVVEEPQVVDTDKDGLTDEEEATLGTSPRSADTDRDELFDYEEVNVYHTNPLSKDTDGDGYEDGVEVEGGYDPNGSGKLFELPSAQ